MLLYDPFDMLIQCSLQGNYLMISYIIIYIHVMHRKYKFIQQSLIHITAATIKRNIVLFDLRTT